MTFPPDLGHRVVVVSTATNLSEVRILVGRVEGYSCERADGDTVRCVTLARNDSSSVTVYLGRSTMIDLDERYTYPEGVMGDVMSAVRRIVSELAEALLSPKAAAPVESVAAAPAGKDGA